MSIQAKVKKPRDSRSLAATLAIAFLTLSVAVLFIAGGLQIYLSILTQQEIIADKQQLIAQDAANAVTSFVQEKFGLLEAVVEFNDLPSSSREQQQIALGKLLRLDPAFHRLALPVEPDRLFSMLRVWLSRD